MPGWAPFEGEARRKDHARAHRRAVRLRANETPSEKRLWKLLRALNREGANFRRQTHIGDDVFDFADLRRKVLIELDGGVHERLPEVQLRDERKTERAGKAGYRVLRILNKDVWSNAEAVIDRVRAAAVPPPTGEG